MTGRSLPVRVRLTLWYAGVLTLVLGVYAGGVYAVLRQSLTRDLDRGLHDDRETAIAVSCDRR